METYVARQAIFRSDKNVHGYELLFRSGLENVFLHDDPDEASANVMANSSLVIGMEALTDNKPAFINITRDLLVREYVSLLPRELVVVEILETIEPDANVIGACKRLKDAGYTIALDDFVYEAEYQDLVDLADIIKIDFLSTPAEKMGELVEQLGGNGTQLLAEKVETVEQFEQARSLGYSYFQGYFFEKPTIVHSAGVPEFKLHYMELLQEINKPEIEPAQLDSVIRREVSLVYKLLRYVNSAYFGFRHRIGSIRHAVALLGETEFKKWASFVVMACMGDDKPNELVVKALARASFCESLAGHVGLRSRAPELFLMGLFSLIDGIVDQPLEKVLKDLPVADDVRAALLERTGKLGDLYQYAVAYERGEWELVTQKAGELSLTADRVPELYVGAVSWAHQIARNLESK